MAQADAHAGFERLPARERRQPRLARRQFRAFGQHAAPAFDEAHRMPAPVDHDLEEAELVGVVAPVLVLRPRRSAVHLTEVLPHEGSGRRNVEIRAGATVVEIVVHMPREHRIEGVPLNEPEQPVPRRLVDVVVVRRLAGLEQERGVVHKHELAHPGVLGEHVLQPGPLRALFFQPRVQHRVVDEHHQHALMDERRIRRTEIARPLLDPLPAHGLGGQRAAGLVADVVVPGDHVQVLAKARIDRLHEFRGRPVRRQVRHRMDEVAQVDDERRRHLREALHHEAAAAGREVVHGPGRGVVALLRLHVRVADHAKTEQQVFGLERPGVGFGRHGLESWRFGFRCSECA